MREVNAGSIDAWIATVTGSGTATHDEVAAATAVASAQFTPDQAGSPDAAAG